jgi:glycosyltransferase involved in cell wall biosynthesis
LKGHGFIRVGQVCKINKALALEKAALFCWCAGTLMATTTPEITISVIVPAYNAARFLPRCLQSIFAQTLQPAEVIVVDDGSTDNTASVAARLGARVIRHENGGVATARNLGIQSATSEWIALLDADDFWMPEKLQLQVACIRPETVFVYTGIKIFGDDGVHCEEPAVDVISARKMLRYCNPITPSTVLAKRELLLHDGGFREDLRACEDWEMWMRLQQLGEFQAVRDPLTSYYVYPGSLSSDPEVMLQALYKMIDTTLLSDLHGFERWICKRRVLAAQLCSAGLIARDNRLKNEVGYIFCSLCAWPSPFWQPRRFALFAVSLRNRFRKLRK